MKHYHRKLILHSSRQSTPPNKISPIEVEELTTAEINLEDETLSMALSQVDSQ